MTDTLALQWRAPQLSGFHSATSLSYAPSASPQLRFQRALEKALYMPQYCYYCRNLQHRFGVKASAIQKQKASEKSAKKNLAVFVSGGGSNLRALHNQIVDGKIHGHISILVSDKPACKACEYAHTNNIPVLEYPSNSPKSSFGQAGLTSSAFVGALRKYKIDFVLLAGYLKLLPAELVQAYPHSILNIHPALLPSFGGKGYYGMKVHEAVIKSGARFSGPTVHFVDEKYDHGVILAQRVVPVLPHDTPQDLAARVLIEEHILYSEAVAALCEDRIFWRKDGVPFIRKSGGQAEYY